MTLTTEPRTASKALAAGAGSDLVFSVCSTARSMSSCVSDRAPGGPKRNTTTQGQRRTEQGRGGRHEPRAPALRARPSALGRGRQRRARARCRGSRCRRCAGPWGRSAVQRGSPHGTLPKRGRGGQNSITLRPAVLGMGSLSRCPGSTATATSTPPNSMPTATAVLARARAAGVVMQVLPAVAVAGFPSLIGAGPSARPGLRAGHPPLVCRRGRRRRPGAPGRGPAGAPRRPASGGGRRDRPRPFRARPRSRQAGALLRRATEARPRCTGCR